MQKKYWFIGLGVSSPFILFVGLLLFGLVLRGCGRPPMAEVVREVDYNKTVFLVDKFGQEQRQVTAGKELTSEQLEAERQQDAERLEQRRVVGLRVTIPTRKVKTGRFSYRIEETMDFIEVTREPMYGLWSGSPYGNSQNGETRDAQGTGLALQMESRDGTKFSVPCVFGAIVLEEDAALFRSWYRGKDLKTVMNSDGRNFFQTFLSTKFKEVDLSDGRLKKTEYISDAETEGRKVLKQSGITLLYFGLYEGLVYKDQNTQDQIDQEYILALEEQALAQKEIAEGIRNQTRVELADNDRQIASLYDDIRDALTLKRNVDLARQEAELIKTAAGKVKSSVPTQVLPSGEGGGVIVSLPAASGR